MKLIIRAKTSISPSASNSSLFQQRDQRPTSVGRCPDRSPHDEEAAQTYDVVPVPSLYKRGGRRQRHCRQPLDNVEDGGPLPNGLPMSIGAGIAEQRRRTVANGSASHQRRRAHESPTTASAGSGGVVPRSLVLVRATEIEQTIDRLTGRR